MSPVDDLSRFQRRRRIAVAILVIVIFAALLFVRSAVTADNSLHEYVEAFGGAAILVAILGRTWCTLYIGGRKAAEIVRSGP
jgi:protein-S-isoprenylcysteine O-methyltransferase Ste14